MEKWNRNVPMETIISNDFIKNFYKHEIIARERTKTLCIFNACKIWGVNHKYDDYPKRGKLKFVLTNLNSS